MQSDALLEHIARGRTDLVFELLRLPDWRDLLVRGDANALQWLAYYGDVTAMRAVLEAGGDLSSLDLGRELGNAAFHGHWKLVDFLISQGADVNWREPATQESPLHAAVSKAGRPFYGRIVQLLLERGADPNAATVPGMETGAFMRDVRTKGEAPLHRAAAFADAATIQLLLDHGADRERRDANGDTPLSWASWHLRPGAVLKLLAFGPHRITDSHVAAITSDHGTGWGNGMDRNLMGDYLPLC